jgi:putative transposase
MKYDPQIHNRRSMRLKGYDYSLPGAYFITFVTYQRDELFGEVVNSEMKLSPLGQIVHDEWMRSIGIRQEIRLNEDEFVIMPNHLHGIIWIVDLVGADGVRPVNGVGPGIGDGVRPGDGDGYHTPEEGACHAPQQSPIHAPQSAFQAAPQQTPGLHRLPRSLSSFVAGFKAKVTSRAGGELNMAGIWQRNYFDHIIRSDREFQNIWEYIDNNPQRWLKDQLHPSAPANQFNQD